MQVGKYLKSPDERERIAFDMTPALATGDMPLSAVCKAYDAAGTDVSEALVDGDAQIGGNVIYQFIRGGIAGNVYYIVVSATTAQGAVIQDSVRVEVIAEPPATHDEVIRLLRETTDLAVIRKYMALYADYDLVSGDNVQRAKVYVLAARKYLSLAEDQISHGVESVRKEYSAVESRYNEARNWLALQGALPGVANAGRISRFGLGGMRR